MAGVGGQTLLQVGTEGQWPLEECSAASHRPLHCCYLGGRMCSEGKVWGGHDVLLACTAMVTVAT